MKFLPRRESRAERKAKAFKATENSTGKHKSAMEAIGKAVGDPSIAAHSAISARLKNGVMYSDEIKRVDDSYMGKQPSHVTVKENY